MQNRDCLHSNKIQNRDRLHSNKIQNRDRLHSNKMCNIYVSYCQDQIKETVDFIFNDPFS